MIFISQNLYIEDHEVEYSSIRSQGAGGQNVNKVSTAIHLRFNINTSSLPDQLKARLRVSNDRRINQDDVIIIKAQSFRTREKNKQDAINRLVEIIKKANIIPKKRRPTKATKGSQTRRLNSKTKRGNTKALRGKVID